jgi:hypothetical protein
MSNGTCKYRIKSLSEKKLKGKISGCCDRRQFLAATAFLSGGANLLASDTPILKDDDPRIEANRPTPVRIPYASIRMRSPNSALFGITSDEVIKITYAEVLKFHGYCGGGTAFAFQTAQEAFKALYGDQLPV